MAALLATTLESISAFWELQWGGIRKAGAIGLGNHCGKRRSVRVTPHCTSLDDWVDGGTVVQMENNGGAGQILLSCSLLLSGIPCTFKPQRLRIIDSLG